MERWQSMRFEMQGFCRKYYPAGVEIFGKRAQPPDLAAQRRPPAVSIDYFCGGIQKTLVAIAETMGDRFIQFVAVVFGGYSFCFH